MTKRTFNPGWPSAQSDTREARRLRKAAHDQRKRHLQEAVEENIRPLGLTLDTMLAGLADGTIRVYII